MTAEKREDRWWAVDRPVLIAVAERFSSTSRALAQVARVADALQLEEAVVTDSMRRLGTAGFLRLSPLSTVPIVVDLSERAYREVGWWPDGDAALDRLLAELDRRIERATGDDRSRLVKMRDATVGLGRDVGVQLLGAYLGLQIGS